MQEMLYVSEEENRKLIGESFSGAHNSASGENGWAGPPSSDTMQEMAFPFQPQMYQQQQTQQQQAQQPYQQQPYPSFAYPQYGYMYQGQQPGQQPPPPPPPVPQQQVRRAPKDKSSEENIYLLNPVKGSDANNESSRSAESSPGYGAVSGRKTAQEQPLPPRRKKTHHRSSSDGRQILESSGFSRRLSGNLSPLPPQGHRRASSEFRPPLAKSPKVFDVKSAARDRLGGSLSSIPKPRHRRGDSTSSMASISSQMSILSDKSIVADIAKSGLFKEVTSSGLLRMHLPVDNVRISMDDKLESGILYQYAPTQEDSERFLDYHLRSEEGDEFADVELPDKNYVLAVEPDLYRRVLGEISDAREMPCGLYFCGHHEDVDRPSILIAVSIVGLVLIAITVLTFGL